MTEQSNAELIAEAQEASASEHEELGDDAYVGGLLDRLAVALKAADQRADDAEAEVEGMLTDSTRWMNRALPAEKRAAELAAVVEKAGRVLTTDHHGSPAEADVLPILATAPADALRERDAEKWGEGAKWVVANQGHELNAYLREVIDNHNPYRTEADRG